MVRTRVELGKIDEAQRRRHHRSMKFALYSDLHLNPMLRSGPVDLPRLGGDVVILAGDIGSHTHGLEWAADRFPDWPSPPKVVYVAGNHEYYDAQLGLLAEMRKHEWQRWGIEFLEQRALNLPGVRILVARSGAASISMASTRSAAT